MRYTKLDFGRDLFFLIGFLEPTIEKHNKTSKNKISMERFQRFKKYCDKRFVNKKGYITGG